MIATPVIHEDDLDMEKWPPQLYEADGRLSGNESCGIKITHIPSGLTAISENQPTLHLNQLVAMDMIVGGLTSQDFEQG